MNLEKTLFAFSIGEKGVMKIDIDYMTDSVIVEFEPTFITKEEIKERLESSGYRFVRVAR